MKKTAYVRILLVLCFIGVMAFSSTAPLLAAAPPWSVARQWNELMLGAIRRDFARPTIHARNLYHVSAAMWDAWAAYDANAETVLNHEHLGSSDLLADREEAISYASYRILVHRFASSPGAATSLASFDAKMAALGYDKNFTSTAGNSPAALGNRIAKTYIDFGLSDNSNEANGYKSLFYAPINAPLVPALPGNPNITDPNRWQPLALDFFVDQGGNVILGGYPPFLSPEWGKVKAFALSQADLKVYQRDGNDYWVYHDPGPPPMIGGVGDDKYKTGFEQVVLWSGLLDPTDGVMIDISPASNGNSPLGTNDGQGYDLNPATGQPYTPQIVPAGDYYRVLAEFWADGPKSETPPGHWFTIANYVSDHPLAIKKFGGKGPVLDDLEWDVKIYLSLGGALHDVAVTVWGMKGWYDWVRPVSAIRYMCDQGQSSDPQGPSYDPEGIHLYPGQIEVITDETAALGGRHHHLAGNQNQHIGKIAARAWRGPTYINNPATDTAGVDWIRCEDWWPYQRPSFVSPPFAGFVSGHSTFSRAASTIMAKFTGSEFFPGGMSEFEAPKNEFLVFEEGPSVDITLQWAKYSDASDETSLSRIYGGIHPTADDIPGRFMGVEIAKDAFKLARELFGFSAQSNRATFQVSKHFTDGNNPTEVEVELNCNTGLPLQQSQSISEGQDVTFVVGSFEFGELNCTVTENLDALDGYTPTYLAAGPGKTDSTNGCQFSEVEADAENTCQITNVADPVKITIEKAWVVDGASGDQADTHYQLTLYCDTEIAGGEKSCTPLLSGIDGPQGVPQNYTSCKEFAGNGPDIFTAELTPQWPSSHCWVDESNYDAAVEVDNGCENLVVSAGHDESCLVTNTMFFEGIPTLNQFGLVVLALLMLGMGLIGFRRFS